MIVMEFSPDNIQERSTLSRTVSKYQKAFLSAHTKKLQHKFLQDCMKNKVIPHTLIPRGLNKKKEVPFGKIENEILKQHIDNAKSDSDIAFYNLRQARRELSSVFMDPLRAANCMNEARRKMKVKIIRKKNQLEGKLNRIFDNSLWTQASNPEKNILNLSSYTLTQDEKLALGFGLSFSFKSTDAFSVEHLISITKSTNSANQEFDFLSGSILSALASDISAKFSDLPYRLQRAIGNLKQNKQIHITKSDKTSQFVILNSVDYRNKLQDLLSDSETYEVLTSNPLNNKVKNFNSKLSKLLGKHKELLKSVKMVNPSLPYMYGLPKTHKDGCPLRPIISSVNSPGYKLSKWLAKHLSQVQGKISTSHVKNSLDFVNKARSINLSGHKLVSFDVNSLFTKVPVDETINFLRRKLPELDLNLPLPTKTFIDLIELCVSDNVFQDVDGKFYRQKFGLAMGNSLSPMMSNIFMEYFETEILTTIHNHPKIWLRYVDDVWSLWPVSQDFDSFFSELNNIHPTIKFKTEWEQDGQLSFLDVMMSNESNNLSFKIYRKPTNAESYIHYFSVHDNSVKMSVISSMFLRAFRICDPPYLEDECDHIRSMFKKLSYPDWFVNKAYWKARKTFYTPSNNVVVNEDISKCVVLPFSPNLANVRQLLKTSAVNVSFKYNNTLSKTLIRNRPSQPKIGAVYAVKCNTCRDVYIGQTGKTMSERCYWHKMAVRRGDHSNAIAKHVQENDHQVDLNNPVTLYSTSDYATRNVIESVLISNVNNFNLSSGNFKAHPVINQIIMKELSERDNIRELMEHTSQYLGQPLPPNPQLGNPFPP